MYEISASELEYVSGGASSEKIIRGTFSNAVYGFLQGIPFGMYFGGKFGASGGILIGAVNQLIGVIGGAFVGSIGFAVMGLTFDDADFHNYMQMFRQIMLPGQTSN